MLKKLLTLKFNHQDYQLWKTKLGLILVHLGIFLTPTATFAAEKLYFNYGPIQLFLSVKTLENYALTGEITGEFANYAGFFEPEQLTQLRQALTTKSDLDVVTVSQFLYSPQGEIILRKLGKIIQTTAGQNGFYAIRSALILAAADDEEGLTPLNVLRKFPTSEINIATEQVFATVNSINDTLKNTSKMIAAVEEKAAAEEESSRTPSYAYYFFPDLRQAGNLNFSQQTLTISEGLPGRTFPVDLYLPETSRSGQVPLIVISHGLGSDRNTFAYLAQHLASHGFAVAMPEHPGSDAEQIQALMSGLAQDVSPPQELLDRPQDIKDTLDRLERDFSTRISTKRVGLIGQSFGGYTTLALAGADLNFTQLEEDCRFTDNSINISLLLQCNGLELPRNDYLLDDPRIVAAIAINPLTSSIFGESKLQEIQIPVMLMSGSSDPVTPALFEQILPFTWLSDQPKYLALMKGGTHFSTLSESSEDIPLPPQVIVPDPAIAHEYVNALALAFFNNYVTQQEEYKRYLQAGYAKFISEQDMPLNLIESLTIPESF